MMLYVIIAALLLASPAWGAVAHNATTTTVHSPTTQTSTHSHTVAGADNVLIVSVTRDATVSVSTITYAGQALSPLPSCTVTPTDGFGRTEIWFKTAPASGTNSIVVTLSAASTAFVRATSFTGASTTAVAADFGCTTATGTSTAPSVAVTSAGGEMVYDALGVSITASETATAGSGQTERGNTTFSNQIIGASSTEIGAASVTMSWTLSDAKPWALAGVRIKASGPPDTQAPTTPGQPSGSPINSTSFTATWTQSTDNVSILRYHYERATFSGSCGTYSEISQPTTNSYLDTGLSSNTTYCVRVRAFDGTNFSNYSSPAQITTLSLRTANLTWTRNATDNTGVEVERCEGPQCNTFTTLTTLGAAVTSYQDTTSPQPVAGYRVRNIKTGAAASNYSNIVYTSASPVAVLGVSPTSLLYTATIGASNPASQSIAISNTGPQGMNWTVSDDASWLLCAPSSGTDNAQSTCSVNISGLTSGTHLATITVSAAGAQGSPRTVSVQLNLSPASQPGGTTPGTSFGGRVR